ncbi:MAG: hypothetical protein KF813_08900 [Trueperaceae bacterium]|nr:hypothetical protein [Trueperaceae bacterium]
MAGVDELVTVSERLEQVGVVDAVFVGGSVVGLLLTDPLAPAVRHTYDVDVVLPTSRRSEYNRIEERLRAAGHTQPIEGPICRWQIDGILVDLMPVHEGILGFGNRWYKALKDHSVERAVRLDRSIRIAPATYLLAMKIEAFSNRGEGDFLLSRDVGDIVAVVDGRPEIVDEVLGAEDKLKEYISSAFRSYLLEEAFLSSLAGHLLPDEASQQRAGIILERMSSIARI